jgi:DNA invertase Pin-like site-specific DNA recombinase
MNWFKKGMYKYRDWRFKPREKVILLVEDLARLKRDNVLLNDQLKEAEQFGCHFFMSVMKEGKN